MTILYTSFERERDFLMNLLIIYIDCKKVGKI